MATTGPTFPERFNLGDYFLLDRIREGAGQKTGLLFGDRSYSYAAIAERARAFAALLMDADIRRGERVYIVLPDAPPFAWVFFGTLLRGSVVAMGNPDASPDSLAKVLDYTRATVLVTTPKVAEELHARIRSGACGSEVRRIFTVPDVPTGGDPEADAAMTEDGIMLPLSRALSRVKPLTNLPVTHRDEPAIWLFTSGSTGEPKANIHSHRDFAFNTEVYAKETVGYRAGDVTVSVPRLFFGYATGTNLMFPFAVGATVGLFSERPTPESLRDAVSKYRPTVVTTVPTMIGKLLDFDETLRAKGEPGLDFDSVRFSLSAGEALPETLLRRWLTRFRSDVYDGIGSAEMFHIYASNRPGDVKPGSLGRAVAGYELRILAEDAEGPGAKTLPPGEIGVLWVRGDSVSHGYWLDRDKSWQTFSGHSCRTGDLFRVDEEGYLYFAGRADELLKVSGQWVAPLEVEECLMKHPHVSLAAVIGVGDLGLVKPKAYVVARPGFTGTREALVADLQAFVKANLAIHKYPRVIEVVEDLPRNDRGKVDRKLLVSQERARSNPLIPVSS